MQPRLVRLRDAPKYLGMDRHRFNNEVRPALTNIPIGKQGIAFDRYELDDWVDNYIAKLSNTDMEIKNINNKLKNRPTNNIQTYHKNNTPALTSGKFNELANSIIKGQKT